MVALAGNCDPCLNLANRHVFFHCWNQVTLFDSCYLKWLTVGQCVKPCVKMFTKIKAESITVFSIRKYQLETCKVRRTIMLVWREAPSLNVRP